MPKAISLNRKAMTKEGPLKHEEGKKEHDKQKYG